MSDDAVDLVRQALVQRGVTAEIRTFDRPVPSAAKAAEQLGCPVGAIANSLIFEAGDSVALLLVSGAHRADVGRVASHLHVDKNTVRRADPATVLAATGQPVGGVAPVGHPSPLSCLIDTALGDHRVIWAGAGDEHSMFPTTLEELIRVTGGTPLQLAG